MKRLSLGILLFSFGTSVVLAGDIPVNPVILYVGDSHSFGKLGGVVEKKLSSLSERVIMESSCGASANTWLGKSGFEKTVCGFWKKDGAEEIRSKEHKMPKFSTELETYKPDVTIVQLGTNMAAAKTPASASASILQMMNEIKNAGSTCIWIGPPDANSKIVTKAKVIEVNRLIADLALKNDCHYIDSLKLTTFPKKNPEGIHYPPSLSAAWGEKVGSIIVDIIKKEQNI